MADDKSASEQGPADPVAIGIALSRPSASVDEALTAYLHDQRHHLHEQLRQIHLDIAEKWLGMLLRLATLAVGLAVAGGLGFLIWQAKHSDGLRVEPFSVPPAFIERGLTGQVVASRVIDRLSELQLQTNTGRPARSYSNAWGDKAIKLELPEAGISLEELDSWLREKVGHETPLSGEVVRGAAGITLTARTGEDGAVSVSGAEADIDALTVRLAEEIYRLTQPYRYAIYLMRHENRPADAAPIFKQLALNGTPDDKRWSYNMWAQAVENSERNQELGLAMYRQALDADPNATGVYSNLTARLYLMGRFEEAFQAQKQSQAKQLAGITMTGAPPTEDAKKGNQANLNSLAGAFHDAIAPHARDLRTGRPGFGLDALVFYAIRDQLGEHDLAAARTSQQALSPGSTSRQYALLIALASGDWRQALGFGEAMAEYLKEAPNDMLFARVTYLPPLALAQAHLGDFAAAEKTIALAPANCLPCLIARAQVAELAGQRGRADYWFGKAAAASPSLPFAFEAEGRALLGRGQPGEAIARFVIAGQKTPHFADALEGWGEALMAQKQPQAALAKFAESEKYAPNWGRLHLKYGLALLAAGKPADAKDHFARAAGLDLTPDEKSELAKVSHG